jgi:hypothetical protein
MAAVDPARGRQGGWMITVGIGVQRAVGVPPALSSRYLPANTAGRFSTNAATPSRKSDVRTSSMLQLGL